jgi:hypothetical protein
MSPTIGGHEGSGIAIEVGDGVPRPLPRKAKPLVRQLMRGVMADSVILAPATITADDAFTHKRSTCVLTGLPSRSIGPISGKNGELICGVIDFGIS